MEWRSAAQVARSDGFSLSSLVYLSRDSLVTCSGTGSKRGGLESGRDKERPHPPTTERNDKNRVICNTAKTEKQSPVINQKEHLLWTSGCRSGNALTMRETPVSKSAPSFTPVMLA